MERLAVPFLGRLLIGQLPELLEPNAEATLTVVAAPNDARSPALHLAGCRRSAASEAEAGRARGPVPAPDPELPLALRE